MHSLIVHFILIIIPLIKMSIGFEVLQVKKLTELAIIPTRGSKYAAGNRNTLSLTSRVNISLYSY